VVADEKPDIKPGKVKKELAKFTGEVIEADDTKQKNVPRNFIMAKKRKKKHPGAAAIDPVALARHSRGTGATVEGVKTKFFKKKLQRQEIQNEFANEQAARTEILLNEEAGFMQVEAGDNPASIKQSEIVASVDIMAATKHFELNLDKFGPYRMRYTKNGRHLLLGGRRGHVAAIDWVTKGLHCEFNAMEEIRDVAWLHLETMFAVAQKNWVHFYDSKGMEIHCVKRMNRVNRLEFLPYHFLLASASEESYLSWLDVSIGELVAQYNAKLGRIQMMCQNPYNATLCVGDSKGVVSMWAPSVREPLCKMLCHATPLTALAVDPRGLQMATAGIDRKVKLWDVRDLGAPLAEYSVRSAVQHIDLSQKGLMAFGIGNMCDVYRRPGQSSAELAMPYLRQKLPSAVQCVRFCPYEDVLGISTATGFMSILVPGAGEPNFDAMEANPFQTKTQRREREVHDLLEKIPMELISLDPNTIAEVDVPTLKDQVEAKEKLFVSFNRC
jgi:U3 small nucleolar RNA-associated protein 7